MTNNIKYITEPKFCINFALYCLALMSIISGYVFFDIFVGPGSSSIFNLTSSPELLLNNKNIFIEFLP